LLLSYLAASFVIQHEQENGFLTQHFPK